MSVQNIDALICGALVTFGLTKLVFRGITDSGTHVKVYDLDGTEREIEMNIFKNLASLEPTVVVTKPKERCINGKLELIIDMLDHIQNEQMALRKDITDLRGRFITPSLTQPAYDPNRCLACGGYHHGTGLPCPNMRAS